MGQNVLTGRWTFQIVEEYDERYYATFRSMERAAREEPHGRSQSRGRDEGARAHRGRPTTSPSPTTVVPRP